MAAVLSIFVVATCGAVGAIARFWLSGAVGQRIGETFPWGTLVVNVSGAGAIGALAAGFTATGAGTSASLLWLATSTGFLGGYTTVSSFSLQTMSLMRVREWPSAFANIVVSVVLCLSAATLGFIAVFVAMRG